MTHCAHIANRIDVVVDALHVSDRTVGIPRSVRLRYRSLLKNDICKRIQLYSSFVCSQNSRLFYASPCLQYFHKTAFGTSSCQRTGSIIGSS